MCHNFSVKIHNLNYYQCANGRFHWLNKPMMSGQFRPWLQGVGSLTARLQQRYADFAVQPVLVAYAKPLVDEAMPLKMASHHTALVREVMLMGGAQVVVFAHSVLPRTCLRGAWNGLGGLGSKPLGATLFANPQVKRTPLSYKKLSRHHLLYQHATQHLQDKPAYLWARRSVFSLKHASMMVTEVFLPQLFKM